MKRPLLLFAVVLALGIIFVLEWKDRPAFLCRTYPSFRVFLESHSQTEYVGSATGVAERCVRRDEGYLLLLRTSNGRINVLLNAEKDEVLEYVGNELRVSGTFFLYDRARNFGSFDYRAYYDALGIYGGLSAESVLVVRKREIALEKSAFWLRERTEDLLLDMKSRYYGEERALLLNDRREILTEEKALYSASGFYALLSSSGLFVSLFGNAFFSILKKRIKSRLLCLLISAGLLTIVGFLTGFSFSMIRLIVSAFIGSR